MALTVARKMRYGFAFAFTALLLGGAATLYTTARLRRTNDHLLRTQQVLGHLGSILTLIVDEESGGRGFALTGRTEFLEPLQRAWERLPEEFKTLRALTADEPDQQARVEQLRALAEEREERSEEIIHTRRTYGLEAAAALVADGGGKVIADQVRRLIEQMNRVETELLLARTHDDQKVARLVFLLQGGLLLLGLVLATTAILLLRSLITQPVTLLLEGVERLAAGDLTARVNNNSSDEFGILARSFNEMARKRESVEEALRESEERFRLTLDGAPIGMALLRLDGQFVRVNKALCELTGYSAEELTRLSFQDITHPDDVETDLTLLARLAHREIAGKRVEKRYLRKNGTTVDVVVNTSVLRGHEGEALYFIAQMEDITERKRAEAALRRSEIHFRELVEQAADGIFIANLDGRYTDVNSAACQMLGYERDELIGKTIMDIIPLADVPRLAAAKEQLSQPGSMQIAEWTLLQKDGAPRSVEVSSKILPDGRWQAIVRDISERKRIEQALRDSEERFRLTIDEAPIGMALVGLDGRFVRVNHALCEIVGYPPDELTALTFQAITHPEDLDTDLALLGRLTRGEVPRYQLDKRYVRRGGAIVDVRLSVSVLRSREGAPTYFIAQVEDVTERKRVEEAVRLSEEKFSSIISLSTDAIISVDSDQRINLYNQGAESIFGYQQSEAVGKRLDLLLPERLHAIHRAHIDGFARGAMRSRRMGERMAILGRRKNGEEFPAEASISKVEVGGQRLFTVILRDVTLRERLQKEQRILAEAGAILTSSLDQEQTLAGFARLVVGDLADLCVVDVTDETGELQRQVVAHADPAKASLADRLAHLTLDRKRPYLASSVAASKQPLLWAEATPEFLKSMAQSAERLEVLRELDPRSGLAVPLLARERFLGVLLFASSSPCRYDQRDLGLAEQLAGRVALALDNSRLYQRAQRATQARDDVLGIVAHDLRNPLSSIGLATQVLRHQLGKEAKGLRSVEIIERSVRRSDRLIKDLLDVTRMESGHLSMERRRFAVGQLVYDSVDAQQALASSASLELHLQVLPELPDVWVDGDRLLQVMENLIGNAVKFTPSGGSITVGAAPRGQEVLLWVADTGPGIPAENLPHVFDRFWQAKRADRKGAGLGLPICKGIIEANGGRIWVESEPGRGSTFYFTVPVWTGSEAQPQPVPETRH